MKALSLPPHCILHIEQDEIEPYLQNDEHLSPHPHLKCNMISAQHQGGSLGKGHPLLKIMRSKGAEKMST